MIAYPVPWPVVHTGVLWQFLAGLIVPLAVLNALLFSVLVNSVGQHEKSAIVLNAPEAHDDGPAPAGEACVWTPEQAQEQAIAEAQVCGHADVLRLIAGDRIRIDGVWIEVSER
jgi:hypothetical protein